MEGLSRSRDLPLARRDPVWQWAWDRGWALARSWSRCLVRGKNDLITKDHAVMQDDVDIG